VLGAFVRSPLPFVILGRVVVCSASIAGLWLVGIAGASLFGELSGTAAILSLGAIFIHVRESHHVWLDVPAATAAIAAAFAAVRSPAVLTHAPETIELLRAQSRIMFHLSGGISLRVLVGAGIGWATLLLALVGLIASARQAPRQTAILASFPIAYTVPLTLASLLYARYLAVLAPFVALFAGYG